MHRLDPDALGDADRSQSAPAALDAQLAAAGAPLWRADIILLDFSPFKSKYSVMEDWDESPAVGVRLGNIGEFC